jgi:hypothetical protein
VDRELGADRLGAAAGIRSLNRGSKPIPLSLTVIWQYFFSGDRDAKLFVFNSLPFTMRLVIRMREGISGFENLSALLIRLYMSCRN